MTSFESTNKDWINESSLSSIANCNKSPVDSTSLSNFSQPKTSLFNFERSFILVCATVDESQNPGFAASDSNTSICLRFSGKSKTHHYLRNPRSGFCQFSFNFLHHRLRNIIVYLVKLYQNNQIKIQGLSI